MEKIIAIASGKGGVGKSTIAANMAVYYANRAENPLNVALVDVDFYGPSIPTLMGGGEISVNSEEKFIPAKRFGVKYMSIAFFLKNPDDAVIWRGPMFSKGISQLFQDVDWGPVDVCIVDLPPGTGDAQLSLSQMLSLTGAVVVSTPQEVALSDVRRAINMFDKVNVPVLGVVENMAGLVLPSGERLDVFGAGGGEQLSKKYNLPLLGSIPLEVGIREGGDSGQPFIMSSEGSPAQDIFEGICQKLEAEIDSRSSSQRMKIVN